VVWNQTCNYKSHSRYAVMRFCNHVFDFRPNCTPLSSITIIYDKICFECNVCNSGMNYIWTVIKGNVQPPSFSLQCMYCNLCNIHSSVHQSLKEQIHGAILSATRLAMESRHKLYETFLCLAYCAIPIFLWDKLQQSLLKVEFTSTFGIDWCNLCQCCTV
jgi:hypothetical protein